MNNISLIRKSMIQKAVSMIIKEILIGSLKKAIKSRMLKIDFLEESMDLIA